MAADREHRLESTSAVRGIISLSIAVDSLKGGIMANPIQVSVPITKANTTLYIMVDTYAAFTQKVSIQPASGQPMIAQGNGEGTRIGFWTTTMASAGIATYTVLIQFNSGSGFQNSTMVQQASFSAVTLNQVVLFSEDATDKDDNDCTVTFMWFTPVTVAARLPLRAKAQ